MKSERVSKAAIGESDGIAVESYRGWRCTVDPSCGRSICRATIIESNKQTFEAGLKECDTRCPVAPDGRLPCVAAHPLNRIDLLPCFSCSHRNKHARCGKIFVSNCR